MESSFDLRLPKERLMIRIRELFERFGYRRYRVSNFEEYDLYSQYKSFLSGERILSFTDLDGRLLALRPDVTLSIIKNAPENEIAKAYYIENVYRESKESNTFREIGQMGLEYMGEVDDYAVAEVTQLAQEAMHCCGEDYLLEIGHMGFAAGLLENMELSEPERRQVGEALAAKSPHLLREAAANMNLGAGDVGRLIKLLELSGEAEAVLKGAEEICTGRRMQTALAEIRGLCEALGDLQNIRLDLSWQNDTEFYDGVLIRGYLAGLARPVLSGGRYDSMMWKLGKSAGAIGFAIYMDELERLPMERREYDVDVWLSYDEVAAGKVLAVAREIVAGGESVRVAREKPEELSFRRHIRIDEGGKAEC